MAKQRKSKAEIMLAGFKIKRQGTIGDNRYLNKIFYENKEKFEKAYLEEYTKMVETSKRPGYSGSVENFKAKFPNARVYAQSLIKNYQKDFSASLQESTKALVQVRFGEQRLRFENNLLHGLKTFNLKDTFYFLINEDFDANKLEYIGNGTYHYINSEGKIIVIDTTNSPVSMEVYELGAKD